MIQREWLSVADVSLTTRTEKVQNMNILRNSWLLFVCLLLYCVFPVSGHAIDAETRIQSITVAVR